MNLPSLSKKASGIFLAAGWSFKSPVNNLFNLSILNSPAWPKSYMSLTTASVACCIAVLPPGMFSKNAARSVISWAINKTPS